MNDETTKQQAKESVSKAVARESSTQGKKVYGEKFRQCRGCRAPMICIEAGECPMEEPMCRLEEAWKRVGR